MSDVKKNVSHRLRQLDRFRVFELLYPAAVFCCLCALAFSVSTLFDKIIAGLMAANFVTVLATRLRRGKGWAREQLREIFRSAKALYVAFALYLAWDILLLLYSRDISLAIRKLPYYLEYLFLFAAGVWYCCDRKHLLRLMVTVACAGNVVALFSYVFHFWVRKPFYFQRMSTCRDYNVFSTLLFVSLVFAVVLIMNFLRWDWWKRMLLLALVLAVNLPSFYLAGSRRMVILLPFFYGFALLYEGLRNVRNRRRLAQNLCMLALCGVAYWGSTALAGPFADYGEQKREAYDAWKLSQLETEEPGGGEGFTGTPQESTIADVLDTIENGSMSNKRGIIYSSGIRELLTYTPLEWAFGRGAAYDIYYYSYTHDETLLRAYGYSEENRPVPGWMSAHNFLLADVLNGGLLKLSLGLFLVGALLFQVVRGIRREPGAGILLAVPVALAISNSCISGAFGMLNDVFFMTMLAVLCGVLRVHRDCREGGEAVPGSREPLQEKPSEFHYRAENGRA